MYFLMYIFTLKISYLQLIRARKNLFTDHATTIISSTLKLIALKCSYNIVYKSSKCSIEMFLHN